MKSRFLLPTTGRVTLGRADGALDADLALSRGRAGVGGREAVRDDADVGLLGADSARWCTWAFPWALLGRKRPAGGNLSEAPRVRGGPPGGIMSPRGPKQWVYLTPDRDLDILFSD
mmetsp:Transcript_63778/g.170890  ORF Transcript_63778/g.170890 Transcript_63778/m.170890 type:complete len:116 (-) Transcript_63778:24-371(-)